MSHATLTGANLHQSFHYIQETDPGTAGAGVTWLKKSTGALKYRNDTNTGWVTILQTTNNYTGAPNTTILSTGATRADIQTAIDDSARGDTVMMPNETIEVDTTPIYLAKPIRLVGHPGGDTKLLAAANVGDNYEGGSAHQIVIGLSDPEPGSECDGVYLGRFAIEHDRVASPNMRTLAIDLAYSCSNVEIDRIGFTNVTSDCVIVRPLPKDASQGCVNVSVHDCTANEYWEAFFNHHEAWLYNAAVYNNVGNVSNVHAGYQGPMGLEINIEGGYGECVGFNGFNNHFTVTGGVGGSGALGFVLNSNSPFSDCRYRKVNIHNNIFDGFFWGGYIGSLDYTTGTLPTDQIWFVAAENQFLNGWSSQVIMILPGGSAADNWRTGSQYDRISLIANDIGAGNRITIDQRGLVAQGLEVQVVDTLDNTGSVEIL